jgi:hypothetical protein
MRRRGRKGPAPSRQFNTSIVMSLVSKVERAGCVDAAVADVTKQYDVSERTVWKLWEEEAKCILETHRLIDARALVQSDATTFQLEIDDNSSDAIIRSAPSIFGSRHDNPPD